jgi:hypothetical protein
MRDQNPVIRDFATKALDNSAIIFHWRSIEMRLTFGESFRDINNKMDLEAPDALDRFQKTYPDTNNFRVGLIEQVIAFEQIQNYNVRPPRLR